MSKPASSKTSFNPNTTGRDHTGAGGKMPPRAHRDDTPEAVAQRGQTPKNHPTANAEQDRARRHDN